NNWSSSTGLQFGVESGKRNSVAVRATLTLTLRSGRYSLLPVFHKKFEKNCRPGFLSGGDHEKTARWNLDVPFSGVIRCIGSNHERHARWNGRRFDRRPHSRSDSNGCEYANRNRDDGGDE